MYSNDTVIKFNDVTKIYKLYASEKKRFLGVFNKHVPYIEKRAVNGMNFSVARGESVALIGRNGAGKSTILKMITGVAYPTTGTIDVKGRVSALLEITAGFDDEMKGRENIYLRGQLMGLRDEEIAKLEPAIVEFAELGDYIDQPVRTYSSGMLSKLGFAINVCIEPEIFIVDEALSVGDAVFKEKCLNKVNEIISKDSVTLLFVTHSIDMAKEFCKRGIVVREGQIMFDGPIDDAAEYYKLNMGN
ncbi:MAG: ABC transporter ATP-binding protein [Clostridiales Family XIII bacterium]|jgi:teichoic acid transport system ATP-binding protein|nr:ABC transporter ATP-binding protein [Clostridiales Family XIII bacterium]